MNQMPLHELKELCTATINHKPMPPCSKCGSYQSVFSDLIIPHLLNKSMALTILSLIEKTK